MTTPERLQEIRDVNATYEAGNCFDNHVAVTVPELLNHIDELTTQRDTARDWAVRLEQENAHLLEQLEEAAAGERLELR